MKLYLLLVSCLSCGLCSCGLTSWLRPVPPSFSSLDYNGGIRFAEWAHSPDGKEKPQLTYYPVKSERELWEEEWERQREAERCREKEEKENKGRKKRRRR